MSSIAGSRVRFGWLQVWLATGNPAAATRCQVAGPAAASIPIGKKVALTRSRWRIARMEAATESLLQSSMVIAISGALRDPR